MKPRGCQSYLWWPCHNNQTTQGTKFASPRIPCLLVFEGHNFSLLSWNSNKSSNPKKHTTMSIIFQFRHRGMLGAIVWTWNGLPITLSCFTCDYKPKKHFLQIWKTHAVFDDLFQMQDRTCRSHSRNLRTKTQKWSPKNSLHTISTVSSSCSFTNLLLLQFFFFQFRLDRTSNLLHELQNFFTWFSSSLSCHFWKTKTKEKFFLQNCDCISRIFELSNQSFWFFYSQVWWDIFSMHFQKKNKKIFRSTIWDLYNIVRDIKTLKIQFHYWNWTFF